MSVIWGGSQSTSFAERFVLAVVIGVGVVAAAVYATGLGRVVTQIANAMQIR
jgi:hypothetical protein